MDTTTTAPTHRAGTSLSRGPALLQPLSQRDFRLVFTGESISLLGDQFHFVALAGLRSS